MSNLINTDANLFIVPNHLRIVPFKGTFSRFS